MDVDYGSKNLEAEGEAFVQRLPVTRRTDKPATARRALAVVGVSLVAGGAYVAYDRLAVDTAPLAPLTLEATQFSGVDVLSRGTPFQLRVPSKNLCAEGGSAFTLQPCNPNNPNQAFVYDQGSVSIRSASRPNMCVDDGGGMTNGQTDFRLWPCDPRCRDQRFIYDQRTQLFRNPAKPNVSLDDGGGTNPGQTKFHIWECSASNLNQQFELRQVAPTGDSVPMILRTNQEVMILASTEPMVCVDDGGGRSNGQTKFRDAKCDPNGANQIWVYDAARYMFRSARKPNMCLDDGGSTAPGQTQFHLWECDPNNINQRFVYQEASQRLFMPAKGLCMDSTRGVYTVQPCRDSPGQQFSIKLPTQVQQPVLAGDAEFLLRIPGKDNLCMDDGGGLTNGQTKFHVWTCDASNLNQVFRYDPDTLSIVSSVKLGMCVDDGGGRTNGETKFHLWQCDPRNGNQKFVYDPAVQRFSNPKKPGMCMDDGGGLRAGEAQFHLWQCDAGNRNQHFEVVPRSTFGVSQSLPTAPMVSILTSSKTFMLRQAAKGSLCADDGGGRRSGETKFILQPCDSNNPNQQFRYDSSTLSIRSATKANLCIDDGGGRSNGETDFHLWQCDTNNNNQKFVYDAATMMFHNPTKGNLCMDDGGGAGPATTKFHLWECAMTNINQKFQVVAK